MQLSSPFIFIVGFMLGVLIWAVSPFVAGTAEPWDAEGPYYILALIGSGLVLGLVSSHFKALLPFAAGLWSGQVAYELVFLTIGAMFILGLGFLAANLLPAVLAALVSVVVRRNLAGKGPGEESDGA